MTFTLYFVLGVAAAGALFIFGVFPFYMIRDGRKLRMREFVIFGWVIRLLGISLIATLTLDYLTGRIG